MNVKEFESKTPRFVLEDYFAGETRAWGLVRDRFGKVRRQFTVDMTGEWDGEVLTLNEKFVYDDGETETVDIVAGTGISNFDQPRDLEGCPLVWQDTNGATTRVGVGMIEWQNPRPDVAVESITIASAGNGVPIVLAVTYIAAR